MIRDAHEHHYCWEVRDEDETYCVRVSVEGEEVHVTWNCGDVYRFTAESVREAVENVRLTAEEHPDTWFADQDMNGRRLAVMIRNGMIYADTTTHEADDVESLAAVPWRDLRKAVRRARKHVKREAEREAVVA